jgi:hypothetical protein
MMTTVVAHLPHRFATRQEHCAGRPYLPSCYLASPGEAEKRAPLSNMEQSE